MQDRIFLRDYLATYYDEIEPIEFYRTIFPIGELEERGLQLTGKYNGIAVELMPKGSVPNAKRYIINDDLRGIEELQHSDNFVIISPISYAGKSRESRNARFIFALAIDLDGVETERNIADLFQQIKVDYIPKPTFIVWSGTGLHLYYQFIEPLPCFKNIVEQLAKLKTELTKKIWNGYISTLAEKPQIESLYQGFRMVGGITKGGNRTAAFSIGEPITIDYLNAFVPEKSRVEKYRYKSKLTVKEAAAKYPEWYEKRVLQGQPRGTWKANRAVYDWWLNELKAKAAVGHRYYCVMVLSVYAKKCGIPREELEEDAFNLIEQMEQLTTEEDNHFTREDVLAALEMFNDNYITFPIDSITKLTAIYIQKNKRNHRKQAAHLARARAVQSIDYPNGEWRGHNGGRPKGSSHQEAILNWKQQHPAGTIKECIAELSISKSSVYRYWKNGADKE